MSEPQNLVEILFNLFVVVPAFGIALVVEITLIVTAVHRFIRWVERKWWTDERRY